MPGICAARREAPQANIVDDFFDPFDIVLCAVSGRRGSRRRTFIPSKRLRSASFFRLSTWKALCSCLTKIEMRSGAAKSPEGQWPSANGKQWRTDSDRVDREARQLVHHADDPVEVLVRGEHHPVARKFVHCTCERRRSRLLYVLPSTRAVSSFESSPPVPRK